MATCPTCGRAQLTERPHRHAEPTWTWALDPTGSQTYSQTYCGHCGHPMHWHECGTGADLTAGPCRCRNDVARFDDVESFLASLDPDPLHPDDDPEPPVFSLQFAERHAGLPRPRTPIGRWALRLALALAAGIVALLLAGRVAG